MSRLQKISMEMKPFSENLDNPCLLKFPDRMEGGLWKKGFSWHFNIQHYILLCRGEAALRCRGRRTPMEFVKSSGKILFNTVHVCIRPQWLMEPTPVVSFSGFALLCAVLSTPLLNRFCFVLLSSDGALLTYTNFFFSLWLVCSQCLLIQFTAVVVTAGAASKYLILFTQYWSRSSWWTCHEAHDLYCNRACYATFWKAQGTESWWHTEVPLASCTFVFIIMFLHKEFFL